MWLQIVLDMIKLGLSDFCFRNFISKSASRNANCTQILYLIWSSVYKVQRSSSNRKTVWVSGTPRQHRSPGSNFFFVRCISGSVDMHLWRFFLPFSPTDHCVYLSAVQTKKVFELAQTTHQVPCLSFFWWWWLLWAHEGEVDGCPIDGITFPPTLEARSELGDFVFIRPCMYYNDNTCMNYNYSPCMKYSYSTCMCCRQPTSPNINLSQLPRWQKTEFGSVSYASSYYWNAISNRGGYGHLCRRRPV